MSNRFCFALLAACIAVSPASAGFREESWDARSSGLGDASTALVDPNGVFPYWNPAALGAVKNGEFGASYGSPSEKRGQKEQVLGAVSFTALQKDSPLKLGIWGTRFDTQDTRREDTYALSLARHIFGPTGAHGLFLGANLKYLSLTERLVNNGDDSAVSGDVGALYAFQNGLSFGLAVRNLNASSVGDATDKKVPTNATLGSAWSFSSHTTILFDVVGTFDDQGEDDVKTRAGLEQRLFGDKVALRIGANSTSINTGIGVRAGMGPNAVLDLSYSYIDPYSDSTHSPTHMGTLKVQFGPFAAASNEVIAETAEETKPEEPSVAASTDEEPAEAKTRSDFVLGPDDVIQIEVKNHPELDVTTVVNPWGMIDVPFVGTLRVKGLTEKEIESSLGKIYTDFFAQAPIVDVVVKEYNSRVVYVLGAVTSPGKYHLKGNPLTLRDVIVMAGLPTDRAATWRVFVVRQTKNGPIFKHINLTKILYRGRLDNNIELESQDIVYVPMGFLDGVATYIGRIFSPIFGLPSALAVKSGT